MPASTPRPRPRRLRARLIALGVVGATMVALPLSQLWRQQQAELDRLSARRAVLDPMARAIDSKRSLLLHGDTASRMLRGRPELEAERRVRQGEVDDRLMALAIALAVGPWERAIQESDALRQDWSLLARGLLEHKLAAKDSDERHGLLVEQSLQIVDLLDQARPARAADEASLSPTAAPRGRPTSSMLRAEAELLDRQIDQLTAGRRHLLAGLLALGVLALWLVHPLWPRTRGRAPVQGPQAAPGSARPSQFEQTGLLMARLRRGDAPPSELPPDSRLDDLHQR